MQCFKIKHIQCCHPFFYKTIYLFIIKRKKLKESENLKEKTSNPARQNTISPIADNNKNQSSVFRCCCFFYCINLIISRTHFNFATLTKLHLTPMLYVISHHMLLTLIHAIYFYFYNLKHYFYEC